MKYTHKIETAVIGAAMSCVETTIIETPDPADGSTHIMKLELDTSDIEFALAELAKQADRGKST